MDEYPNEDDEFELTYADELELLNEQDDFGEVAPACTKNLNPPVVTHITQTKNVLNRNSQPASSTDTSINETTNVTNKRTIQELFGDIDDILDEGNVGYVRSTKRSKVDKESADMALIEQIVELRKLAKYDNHTPFFGINYITTDTDYRRDNLSFRVPKFPFFGVTRHDGKRVYVRCHSEQYEKDESARIAQKCSFAGVMGETFKDVWKEAAMIINKEFESTQDNQTEDMSCLETPVDENKNLWVEMYKPRKYLELLSDESTNRTLLRWLKLWDKVVFSRRPKIKPVKVEETKFKFKNQELMLKLDEQGRPEYKVALLCGPPGLGKTTLAHMVAKHLGYNVIEINASDDRSLESFKKAIENSTSMRSVIDKENRPNCLVFDEIDGAPLPSIEFLVKFVTGNYATKLKKGKNQRADLKRPIICICNDVYVPALRSLRQIAFVVNFPPTTSTRLAERLNEITRREGIKTDMGALLALAEKTGNDIRSCLSVLQFFKAKNKPTVTLSDVLKTSIGEKDIHKGLFAVWQGIFQIERPKKHKLTDANMSLKSRMSKILHTVNSFGDYERLMQGVFENYPSMSIKDSSMVGLCEAMEWFCRNDVLNRKVLTHQEYSLSTYLQYGFVMWHFVFASLSWQKIKYPHVGYEVKTKTTKLDASVSEILRGLQPSIRSYVGAANLKLEIVPHLIHIITPAFRAVIQHLHTQQEKDQLRHVVSTMIDYNLNYVQERTPDGTYVYNLDPNMEDVAMFGAAKPKRVVSYAYRQLIAREIELEKMRRIESGKKKGPSPKMCKTSEETKALPNHLQKLRPKTLASKETIVRKDFFGRIVNKEASATDFDGTEVTNNIWFQYKEGYTNAVRKKIKVKSLK